MPERQGEKETTRAKASPKARAQERASKMRKERVLGKASRIKRNSKVPPRSVARQDTSGANVGRKAVAARIMMVQNLSVGHSSTSEIETWRCSGTSVSCKSAHESQVFIHAESDRVVPNSNVALHVAESSSTQQSTVDRTHQPDIRPESAHPVNPVILSNTAQLVVDSESFDHCCPLKFATQFELKEGRFLNAAAANTIKLKHYGTRVVEGWTRDVNGTEIPLKIKFNVFDVKSPWLSTRKLRKHGYSVSLDQQQTIQKNGSTIALTDQKGLPTLKLRFASRAGEVDEKMCGPFEEIGEKARRATPCTCPGDPQTLSDELTKSTTCRTDLGANTA